MNFVVGVMLMALGTFWLASSWEQGLALVSYGIGIAVVANWWFLK